MTKEKSEIFWRKELIKKAEEDFGMNWKELRQNGYRAKKVLLVDQAKDARK